MPSVKVAIIALSVLAAGACTQGDRNAALRGAAVGAAAGGVGAAVGGGSAANGAVRGATIGAAVTLVTRPLLRILP